MLTILSDWTNKKAHENPDLTVKYMDGKRRHSRQWTDVTPEELSKFIAMVMLMGVIRGIGIIDKAAAYEQRSLLLLHMVCSRIEIKCFTRLKVVLFFL